jgi:hypothetical protein
MSVVARLRRLTLKFVSRASRNRRNPHQQLKIIKDHCKALSLLLLCDFQVRRNLFFP